MYCPLKLYLQNEMDEEINSELLLHKTMKELRIDLQDLFQRNLRRLKKDMEIEEIEENLSRNIDDYIKNSIAILENSDLEDKINLEEEITKEKNRAVENFLRDFSGSVQIFEPKKPKLKYK